MEIPVIFDAGIASLTVANPPLISRLLSIFELGRFSPPQMFWKWGALLLAFIYAFSSVVRRVQILFLQRHRKIFSSSEPLFSAPDDDDDEEVFSEDDEEDENDDVSCSSEDERDENLGRGGFYEDFRVAGSVNSCRRGFKIRQRRSLTGCAFSSLAELVSGKGVVKLWDGLGLGLNLGDSSDSISVFDLDRNVTIGSIVGQIPAVSVSPSSPRVVYTASAGGDGSVGLSSWDMRLRRRRPAVEVEWRMERRTVVGLDSGGVDKVYVRDDVSGKMTVGDMRKARSPLVNVTEYDGGERWFETNVVSETEEEELGIV